MCVPFVLFLLSYTFTYLYNEFSHSWAPLSPPLSQYNSFSQAVPLLLWCLLYVCGLLSLIRVCCPSIGKKMIYLSNASLSVGTLLKSNDIPSSNNCWLLVVVKGWVEPHGPFVHPWWNVKGSILFDYCADNHSCREFMSAVAMSDLEDISLLPNAPSCLLTLFSSPLPQYSLSLGDIALP